MIRGSLWITEIEAPIAQRFGSIRTTTIETIEPPTPYTLPKAPTSFNANIDMNKEDMCTMAEIMKKEMHFGSTGNAIAIPLWNAWYCLTLAALDPCRMTPPCRLGMQREGWAYIICLAHCGMAKRNSHKAQGNSKQTSRELQSRRLCCRAVVSSFQGALWARKNGGVKKRHGKVGSLQKGWGFVKPALCPKVDGGCSPDAYPVSTCTPNPRVS